METFASNIFILMPASTETEIDVSFQNSWLSVVETPQTYGYNCYAVVWKSGYGCDIAAYKTPDALVYKTVN